MLSSICSCKLDCGKSVFVGFQQRVGERLIILAQEGQDEMQVPGVKYIMAGTVTLVCTIVEHDLLNGVPP